MAPPFCASSVTCPQVAPNSKKHLATQRKSALEKTRRLRTGCAKETTQYHSADAFIPRRDYVSQPQVVRRKQRSAGELPGVQKKDRFNSEGVADCLLTATPAQPSQNTCPRLVRTQHHQRPSPHT